MSKVLLVSMPFGALDRPALGLSQLKAELDRRGICCEMRYFTFLLAEYLGSETYNWIQSDLPYTALAGDWCFTESLYGPRPREDERYLSEVFCGTWRQGHESVQRLLEVRAHVESFIERCMVEIDWDNYSIIGFTSSFEQNIASLALASRLKAKYPDIKIVFGGANWENEMGQELQRQFPFVDYVCSGESEHSFPELVRRIFSNKEPKGTARKGIPGVFHRHGSSSISGGSTELVTKIDTLAIPDFSDYFNQLNNSTVASSIIPTLLIESSRGCWWGAKSHCAFCGLNGNSMVFRSKSAKRILSELEYLVDHWRTDDVQLVDNILDMHYFRDVLPVLAESDKNYHLFYEVKANLTREQVELLSKAGIERIQPGIESLSDHVLRLIHKGTTGLRNIQLLKWCREYGVGVDWNLLYGFPGETAEDYHKQLSLMDSIRFLQPPGACGPMRLDRFSPYFNKPESYGLRNLRPMNSYSFLYPFDQSSLNRIAYYFDYDYEQRVDPTGFADAVIQYVDDWNRNPEPGSLRGVVRPDGKLALIDTRNPPGIQTFVLAGLERAAYEYCDQMRTLKSITRYLRKRDEDIHEDRLKSFLDSLISNRLMITDGANYLSLALEVKLESNMGVVMFEDLTPVICEVT